MPPHRNNCSCKRKKANNPLATLCIVGGILIFTLYVIVFIEIDGINIFNILTNKSSIDEYNIFKTPENQFLQIQLERDKSAPATNLFDINSDDYFKMFEYIHNTQFKELSPELQTRHLQELFRYRIIETIHKRQKQGDKKQSGQGELLTLLNEIYFAHKSGINFVQIGACDGNWEASNDPIQKFILQKKDWHGVMLEPVPYLFDTLSRNVIKSIPDWTDRILPINAALSDHDGYQTFFVVNPHFAEEMPQETHALKFQIGSFNKEHIVKHLKVKRERGQLSQELDHYIDGINVTTLSAMSVVKRYRESGKIVRDGSIDVLTIDAEGYDFVVLKGFLVNTTIRPLMVIYENLHLSNDDKKAAIQLLHDYGYIVIDDSWNTIGIRTSNL